MIKDIFFQFQTLASYWRLSNFQLIHVLKSCYIRLCICIASESNVKTIIVIIIISALKQGHIIIAIMYHIITTIIMHHHHHHEHHHNPSS